MCLQCRYLGALINAGKDPASRFNCLEKLGRNDFRADAGFIASFADPSAWDYLRNSLERFSQIADLNLVPITVASDGSCLPHAVSRSLNGTPACLRPPTARAPMHAHGRTHKGNR